MAQTTILASGNAAATSSDVVLASGDTKTISLFATGVIGSDVKATVFLDTPGTDLYVADLTWGNPSIVISAPGTYRVARAASIASVGVFTEG